MEIGSWPQVQTALSKTAIGYGRQVTGNNALACAQGSEESRSLEWIGDRKGELSIGFTSEVTESRGVLMSPGLWLARKDQAGTLTKERRINSDQELLSVSRVCFQKEWLICYFGFSLN